MMSYLDLAILLVLAWGGWKGLRSGGINFLAGWAGYILGAVVAGSLAAPLAAWVESAWHLGEIWGPALARAFPLPRPILAQGLAPAARQQVEVYLQGLFLPAGLKDGLVRSLAEAAARGQANVGQALGGYLVLILLKIALAVLLFFLTLKLLRWLAAFLSRMLGFTPLGPFNRILGLVLGAGAQAVWLSLFLGLLALPILQSGLLKAGGLSAKIAPVFHNSLFIRPLEELYFWLKGMLQHTLF
ncbi:MAG: hypothetical protein PWP65_2019 [Clostridia bacterium]|nr:hypothetical protein [Clostridia bacterium]